MTIKYKIFDLNRIKPIVPERDSSLYECFSSAQNSQIYNTFRPLNRLTSNVSNFRHNSNSSSNEADEESSLSSLNSNHHLNSNEENVSMSTFKSHSSPSKPNEIKRKSNHRKQVYATLYLNSNNNNNTSPSPMINDNEMTTSAPPPPPPPLPNHFHSINQSTNEIKSDFQNEIEQAKTRLKKVSSSGMC